ncbi:MAG: FABP family protein [Propionibacteriaceae bacterium]
MAFVIPEGLSSALIPLAWMLGSWEGSGKLTYPGIEEQDFAQKIDFSENGGDYLHYLSQTFEVDPDGQAVRPMGMETGFWRAKDGGELEVVMTQPDGYAEVWYGKIAGAKIELATDAIMRTTTAAEYTAGQRLYGNVESDLLWTFDKAADGQPLQSYMWARLQRAEE